MVELKPVYDAEMFLHTADHSFGHSFGHSLDESLFGVVIINIHSATPILNSQLVSTAYPLELYDIQTGQWVSQLDIPAMAEGENVFPYRICGGWSIEDVMRLDPVIVFSNYYTDTLFEEQLTILPDLLEVDTMERITTDLSKYKVLVNSLGK